MSDQDLLASLARWLTLNDNDVARDILDRSVNNQQSCRKARAYISIRTAAVVHLVGEWGELSESTYHVLFVGLRANTFLYSVLNDQKAEHSLTSYFGSQILT